jgi:hypothetical protein
VKTLTIRYYDFDKKEPVEMTVPTDCVEIKIPPQAEVYAEAVADSEQNPEARDADSA